MHNYKQVLLALSALQVISCVDVPRFPVKKNFGPSKTIQKRSANNAMLFEITNEESYYSVDVVLGSDNQTVTALLDTGSSDLWVLGTNASGIDACEAYLGAAGYLGLKNTSVAAANEISNVESNCDTVGTFSPVDSKTFKIQKPADPFFIQYGDLTFASGYWGSDSLTVNGVEVNNLLFGVANMSNSTNVCGIGFMENEASNYNFTAVTNETLNSNGGDYFEESFVYKNLPYLMKDQGLISRVSYSLFLNALGADSGDLLFGAIDTSKYVGGLSTVPLINIVSDYYDAPVEFDITLQGVGYVAENGTAITLNQQYFAALADSGTTYLHVPQDLGDLMAGPVGAKFDYDLGFYLMTCPNDKAMDMSAFVFQFGGENYFFPYKNFILNTSNETICALSITTTDQQQVILGDNVLSSLYVVYDLEKYELSLARANYDGADSIDSTDIMTIPSAKKSIMEATTAPGYFSTWFTTVEMITFGGDIFSGASVVSNPWATTSTKYFATFNSDNSYTPSGTYAPLNGTASSTKTKTGFHTTGTASSTNAVPSSSKSNNGAGIIGSSFISLVAALFI